MKILSVPQTIWRPVLNRAVTSAGKVAAVGYAGLRSSQAEGSGLPIGLAFSYAEWSRGSHRDLALWQPAAGYIAGLAQRPVQALQEWCRSNPSLAIKAWLLPAARLVSQRLGRTAVYVTRETLPTDIDEAEYQGYQAAFEKALHETWIDDSTRVARLAIATQIIQQWRLPRTRGPIEVPPTAAICEDSDAFELFLAAPLRPTSATNDTPRADLTHVSETRAGRKPQQDGVVGVRRASPGEDPSAMLVSEWALPDALMIDRLTNEGFLAYDRPPTAELPRNILLLLVSLNIVDAIPASIARAAWWLAALRLGSHSVRKITVAAAGASSDRPDPTLTVGTDLGPARLPFRSADRVRALAEFDVPGQPFALLRQPVHQQRLVTATAPPTLPRDLPERTIEAAMQRLDLRPTSFDDVLVTVLSADGADDQDALNSLEAWLQRKVMGRAAIDRVSVSPRGFDVGLGFRAAKGVQVTMKPDSSRESEALPHLTGRLSDRIWSRMQEWAGHV